jgi:hypothetical protein
MICDGAKNLVYIDGQKYEKKTAEYISSVKTGEFARSEEG